MPSFSNGQTWFLLAEGFCLPGTALLHFFKIPSFEKIHVNKLPICISFLLLLKQIATKEEALRKKKNHNFIIL
jgi:hypothetical protein